MHSHLERSCEHQSVSDTCQSAVERFGLSSSDTLAEEANPSNAIKALMQISLCVANVNCCFKKAQNPCVFASHLKKQVKSSPVAVMVSPKVQHVCTFRMSICCFDTWHTAESINKSILSWLTKTSWLNTYYSIYNEVMVIFHLKIHF